MRSRGGACTAREVLIGLHGRRSEWSIYRVIEAHTTGNESRRVDQGDYLVLSGGDRHEYDRGHRNDRDGRSDQEADLRRRAGAIDGACAFTQQMLPALAAAADHPDMTEELADVLTTPMVEVEYQVESGANVRN